MLYEQRLQKLQKLFGSAEILSAILNTQICVVDVLAPVPFYSGVRLNEDDIIQ